MNDDPDLELEAVSAAVDDLATAEERALVESSPALQADVTTFAAIRARVADVSVPPAARESALAAALAAFDQLSSDEPAAASTRAVEAEVVPLAARRRRQYRLLAGAAAAVAVLAVGAAVVGTRDGDDEAAEVSASSVIEMESPAAGTTVLDGGAAGPAERSEPKEDPDQSATQVEEPGSGDADPNDGSGADDVTAADEAADTEVAAAPAPAATIVIDAPASVIPAISSPEELVAYAAAPTAVPLDTTDAPEATTADTTGRTTADTTAEATADTTADTAAPDDTVLEDATSLAALDPDLQCVGIDTEYVGLVTYRGTPAHVLRVIDGGELRAHAAADCRLLAVATP
jgi:hypothetical protein